MWDLDPPEAAGAWASAEQVGSGRAILGIGASHPALAARAGHVYDKPLVRLRDYLDVLDSLESPVPTSARVLGANGPQMLRLAGQRSAGALTQLVTPERTAEQRSALGMDATLATEVKVVLAHDREAARRLGRNNLHNYLGFPSYQGNLARMGFDEADFRDGGSDRLVDALVSGPTVEEIQSRVEEYRDAGADHICLHVLTDGDEVPLEEWRQLAPILVAS
jgi:probable F420-dependent oxidoreductase